MLGARVNFASQMEDRFVVGGLLKLESNHAKAGGNIAHADRLALAHPLRRNNGEQMQLVALFANEHGTQQCPILRGKPAMWS